MRVWGGELDCVRGVRPSTEYIQNCGVGLVMWCQTYGVRLIAFGSD